MRVNEIICGDNIQVLKTFPNECIDLTVTSPPYDNLRSYNGYCFDFEGLANELYRTSRPGAVVVWVVGDATVKGSETGTSFKQSLYFKEIGFNLHDTMIWYKRTVPISGNRYDNCFEYMFVFSKGRPRVFNPIKVKRIYNDNRKKKEGQRLSTGERTYRKNKQSEYVNDVNMWKIPVGLEKASKHPARFPEELAKKHILSWSNDGDLVLDPFVGSGTTAKMASVYNRKYIGVDISKEYCDESKIRIKESRLQIDMFQPTPEIETEQEDLFKRE